MPLKFKKTHTWVIFPEGNRITFTDVLFGLKINSIAPLNTTLSFVTFPTGVNEAKAFLCSSAESPKGECVPETAALLSSFWLNRKVSCRL